MLNELTGSAPVILVIQTQGHRGVPPIGRTQSVEDRASHGLLLLNSSIWVFGQKLNLWRQIRRRWRRHFNAMMFEESVQLVLKLSHLSFQSLHMNFRAFVP